MACLIVTGAFAQPAVLNSAYSYLRQGTLDKAKTNIDMACANDQTKGLAKCWFYRGNIYLSLYLNPKYKALDTNALQVAYDAYQKAIEIDKEVMNENINPSSPIIGLYVVGEQFYNQGVDLYNQKKYATAMAKFERTRQINASFGAKDTTATYNAALCAIQIKDDKKAKTFLEDLVKNQFRNSYVYSSLSNIYKNEGDTTKAFAVIVKGRKVLGDDLNLVIAECNLYLSQNKGAEAQKLLDIAVQKDPNNPMLHYAIGVNMAEFNKFEEAEKSYLKAIELKPDYFDAIYNLGALYVNTAASLMEQANKLPMEDTEGYNKLKTQADDLLNKAIPVLEKAEKLNPNDLNTLYSLKQLYTRTNNIEKLKEIDAKIAGMRK
jgi:tetratricopeptide (TPR) repeat protein